MICLGYLFVITGKKHDYLFVACGSSLTISLLWNYIIQVDQVVQDYLFTRISDHYVKFLRECAAIAVDTKCASTFLRRYPDSICQAVYSTFIHGYPASWKRFNEEFRTDLCNIVYMWQVGKIFV